MTSQLNRKRDSEDRRSDGGPRAVWTVAAPLIVSMVAHTVMSLADVWFISRLGTAEVAGVGLAIVVNFSFVCFGLGLLGAVKVVVAQAVGAENDAQAREAPWVGLCVAIILGVLVLAVIPLTKPIMVLLGSAGAVADYGADYFSIRLWGALGVYITLACFGWYDGYGKTKVAMRVMVFANIFNIALDPILIFGWGPIPPLGVEGAALTTVIAQWLQAVMGLWLIFKENPSPINLRSWLNFAPGTTLMRLLKLGLPMGIQMSLQVFAYAAFTSMVARHDAAHLAAHNIVLRLASLAFLPCHAIGQAATILVGQAFGARQVLVLERTMRSAQRLGLALMLVLCPLFLGYGHELVGAFRNDVDVVQTGGLILKVLAVFLIVDAIVVIRTGALNGLGDTQFTMYANVLLAWGLMVPLAYYASVHHGLGAPGAWVSTVANASILAGVLVWRWRSGQAIRMAETAAVTTNG
jgi:putative MATE family efflux protein